MKKINPRRKPATQADVERAKRLAVQEATRYAWAIVFTVLVDKEHATPEILHMPFSLAWCYSAAAILWEGEAC